ncbi:MAG: HAMP domain-containing sensor histidine kinase [Cellulosilyticaceae bacterium]
MISIRKQLFAMLLCVGTFTIILTALFVNITIHVQFKDYVEKNIQNTSAMIVCLLEEVYGSEGNWDKVKGEDLFTQTQTGKFSVAVLDTDKKVLWGKTREELLKEIETLGYPSIQGRAIEEYEDIIYTFEDIPIRDDNEIVGYARIGYFPSFILSSDDIMFQANINSSIIGSGLIALVCFILIGVYITRLFTKPIYAIARTSVDLAQGKYTVRYERKSRIKELENLRHSMNYLAQTLEEQDLLRKKLISDVSHEIRTPLHILQSNLEAMIDGIYPIDEDQMEILHKEVVRFSSLISNLDKLKNIEDDVMELNIMQVELSPALKDLFNTFKIVAREKGIKYHLDIRESEGVMILADTNAIKQIFMNILSNAFKFTESGSITLRTEIRGKDVQIIVEDTGIGIAKEDVPYIFERMYRGDKSREKYEGSGLGLTIVKKLVTMHKGQIEVESEEVKGSKFIINLPIASIEKSKQYKVLTIKA